MLKFKNLFCSIISLLFLGTLLFSCANEGIITYEVSIFNNDGGAVEASATRCFNNDLVVFTIKPIEDYALRNIYINGVDYITDVYDNTLRYQVVEDIRVEPVFDLDNASNANLNIIFDGASYDLKSENINKFNIEQKTVNNSISSINYDGEFLLNGSGDKNQSTYVKKSGSTQKMDFFYCYNTISRNFVAVRNLEGSISTSFSYDSQNANLDPNIFQGINIETSVLKVNYGVENAIKNLFNLKDDVNARDFISYKLENNKCYFEFKYELINTVEHIKCLFNLDSNLNKNIIDFEINDYTYELKTTNFNINKAKQSLTYKGTQEIGVRKEQNLYDFDDFLFGTQDEDIRLSFVDYDNIEISNKNKAKKDQEVYAKLNFSNPLYGSFLIDFPSITSVNSRSFEVSNNKMSKKIGLKFNESGEDTIEFTFNKGLKKSVKIFVE